MSETRVVPRLFRATIAAALITLSACATQGATRTIQLDTLNSSGVTGSVMLIDAGQGQTQVEVRVEPAGNLDMPAHIHPGTCAELVPQPRYPLHNVINGVSITVVPASMADLLGGGLAVNVHRSNDDLRTYTACADLL